MKITLVVGNGFDLDAGLKTSYKDFTKSDYWPFCNSRQVYGHNTLRSYLREINSHYFYLTKIAAPNYSSHHILPDMMESDEVIIFGHSLGSNDYPYFVPFFKRQLNYDIVPKKRKRIAIFTKDENGRIEIKKRLLEMTENQTTLLYTLNDIPIFLTDGSMEKEIGDYLKSINKLWE